MPEKKSMVEAAFSQQKMLVEKTTVNIALNWQGIPDNRVPVNSITANSKRMMDDCYKDSSRGGIRLMTIHWAASTCNSQVNDIIYFVCKLC